MSCCMQASEGGAAACGSGCGSEDCLSQCPKLVAASVFFSVSLPAKHNLVHLHHKRTRPTLEQATREHERTISCNCIPSHKFVACAEIFVWLAGRGSGKRHRVIAQLLTVPLVLLLRCILLQLTLHVRPHVGVLCRASASKSGSGCRAVRAHVPLQLCLSVAGGKSNCRLLRCRMTQILL